MNREQRGVGNNSSWVQILSIQLYEEWLLEDGYTECDIPLLYQWKDQWNNLTPKDLRGFKIKHYLERFSIWGKRLILLAFFINLVQFTIWLVMR